MYGTGSFLIRKYLQLSDYKSLRMEAWAGIEPAIELLQSSALPLGYHAAFFNQTLPAFAGESTGLLKPIEFQAESPGIVETGEPTADWGQSCPTSSL